MGEKPVVLRTTCLGFPNSLPNPSLGNFLGIIRINIIGIAK